MRTNPPGPQRRGTPALRHDRYPMGRKRDPKIFERLYGEAAEKQKLQEEIDI